MIITDTWIATHGTGANSWTAAQLRCLGVPWPPPQGWRRRLIGTSITDEQARGFEALGLERRRKLARQTLAAGPLL